MSLWIELWVMVPHQREQVLFGLRRFLQPACVSLELRCVLPAADLHLNYNCEMPFSVEDEVQEISEVRVDESPSWMVLKKKLYKHTSDGRAKAEASGEAFGSVVFLRVGCFVGVEPIMFKPPKGVLHVLSEPNRSRVVNENAGVRTRHSAAARQNVVVSS